MRGKLKDGESSERQGGSMWWNWCAHMYKVCSRPFQGHGTCIFVFLLRKDKNQASISPLLESSIGSCYIFTRPQKWPKTRFLGLLTQFFSKTRANSLFPSPDSDPAGENLSRSVIIGQVTKKMFENVGQCNYDNHDFLLLITLNAFLTVLTVYLELHRPRKYIGYFYYIA